MFFKWPWRAVIRWLARSHGFIDPLNLLSSIEKLAQPSEVSVPVELLRAGMVFHARGLINTKVIQQNLDWQWPYWVRRQFDPHDNSFLPRAFSMTHVNLTHRNWTAVGTPGCETYPLIDPRGLLTPFFDSWSIDAAILPAEGSALLPARAEDVSQKLELDDELGLVVETSSRCPGLELTSRVWAEDPDRPKCCMTLRTRTDRPARLAVAIRPFNPEGVSFVRRIAFHDASARMAVNECDCIALGRTPHDHRVSTYARGDVLGRIDRAESAPSANCRVGLATSAALYDLAGGDDELAMTVDLLADRPDSDQPVTVTPSGTWRENLTGLAELSIPDRRMQRLYDQAVRNLILLSPADVYPGPYTYRRFWFRDAVLMLQAMLAVGMIGRAQAVLQRFLPRQRTNGYFHSQKGEWDSNGQVLWLLRRFVELTGRSLPPETWAKPVARAGQWIQRKRCRHRDDPLHNGLMPAGFSAEHLGNNDYYYWDDYWSTAGLRDGGWLLRQWGQDDQAELFQRQGADFAEAIKRSLRRSRDRRSVDALPASPYRRMDAGAVGSLAAGYPLGLLAGDDTRLAATVDTLRRECFVDGLFFQQMIHSGLNAYLTLHVAQVMLRAGRGGFFNLVADVANAASPTGQWPEAIHPATGGGCMGDGQHGWALAEWVMMLRNMFLREEGDRLVLAAGIPPTWLDSGQELSLGPAPTSFGPVTVRLRAAGDGRATIQWTAQWRSPPEAVDILPPLVDEPVRVGPDESTVTVQRAKEA